MLSTNIYYITLNKLSLLHERLFINACQDFKPLAVSASLMPWLEQQRTRNFQWKPGRRKLDVDRILKVGDWLCINSCIQESFPIMDTLARPLIAQHLPHSVGHLIWALQHRFRRRQRNAMLLRCGRIKAVVENGNANSSNSCRCSAEKSSPNFRSFTASFRLEPPSSDKTTQPQSLKLLPSSSSSTTARLAAGTEPSPGDVSVLAVFLVMYLFIRLAWKIIYFPFTWMQESSAPTVTRMSNDPLHCLSS
ncbi:hypothetical protein PoB_000921600 [Plakobranchus ocellatus]|uniref:Uncharacterized protein n=1 Tax=Plakobranchus ocellatus TaxID=259542 RepID=A0AAV3YHP5_9GAST|nr:hypothetical protein PoB_000921600 [Plakobranchus ocellatus]